MQRCTHSEFRTTLSLLHLFFSYAPQLVPFPACLPPELTRMPLACAVGVYPEQDAVDAARRAEHAAEDVAYRGFSKGVAEAGAAEESTGKVGSCG